MQQDLAVRYHEALGRLVAAWPAAFSGTDLDPEATRKRMEKLVDAGGGARLDAGAPAVRACRRRNCWRGSGGSGSRPTRLRAAVRG